MCSFSSSEQPPLVFTLHRSWLSKKQHHHLRLSLHKKMRAQFQEARWRKKMIEMKTEIKMRNLKLYMENQCIIEENEKLRKEAVLLHKENQILLFHLQKKFSQQNNGKTKYI